MTKLLTSLLILLSVGLFAQNAVVTYKVQAGPWNPYTRTHELETSYATITIIFDKSVIYVKDDARSVYLTENSTLEQNDASAYIMSWDARDEQNRRCKIFIGTNHTTREKSMIVGYNDYMFQYFYR